MTTTALRSGAMSSPSFAGVYRAAATRIISHRPSARGGHASLNMPFRASVLLASAALLSWPNAPLSAQTPPIETAKPADAVSPYGVSYTTGSFTYSLPLLEIGNGDWPERLTLVLNYDSSGNRQPNQSWTLSHGTRFSLGPLVDLSDPRMDPDRRDLHPYGYHFVIGNTAVSFEKEDEDRTVGEYLPVTRQGHTLTYEMLPGSQTWYPDSIQEGHFTFTSREGDTFRIFQGQYSDNSIPTGEHTRADGDFGRWTLLPNGSNVFETNRGLVVMIEQISLGAPGSSTRRFCSYNFTLIDRATVQDCSQSTQVASVTYGYGHGQVLSVQRPDGQIYTFEYVQIHDIAGPNTYEDMMMPPRTRYHLSCVREPGQSACSIRNEYDACDGPGSMFNDLGWTGSRDRVFRQTLADGRVINYSYSPTSLPCRGNSSVTMNDAGASRTFTIGDRNVDAELDPLNRLTQYQWVGRNPQANYIGRDGNLGSVNLPEGNGLTYQYDDRGNVTEARREAMPGSGLLDLVQSAVYPATCANPRTCNAPLSATDARGNTTNYEYDPNHGGPLSVTGPADANGIRPKKRLYYQQRYAWIRSGGGYVQAASPIWLLASERFCRTSTTVGDGCAGGALDEVVTSYDYGPDAGPNNLWLRGQAVTAESGGALITLRTCWGYDAQGRRISETQPNANLASCP